MNNSEKIIQAMRESASNGSSAVEVADLITNDPTCLREFAFITFFKRAFPSIPLLELRRLEAWQRFPGGDLSDEDFNRILEPWLKVFPELGEGS